LANHWVDRLNDAHDFLQVAMVEPLAVFGTDVKCNAEKRFNRHGLLANRAESLPMSD
jgi:hypothetical protein